MTNNRRTSLILIGIFFILSIYPLFAYLGNYVLHIWDEGLYAASAAELTQTGNIFVRTFNFKPDMWVTKPPLGLWLQAISIEVFGLNEFAVRFPSAVAAVLTGIIIILFAGKLQRPFIGFYAALILILSKGIIGWYHVCRSGDYESLLLLFVTTYILCFYLYCYFKKNVYLLIFFIALTLAVLTKSVQALIPMPALFLYALYKKDVLRILKSRTFYWGILIFVLLVGTYYIGRELQNNGYLKAVWNEELGGRFNHTIDGHKHGFGFYFEKLYQYFSSYFIWILPVAIALNWFVKSKSDNKALSLLRKDLSIYTFGTAIVYLLIISCAKTKLEWYNIITLPLFAIFIGIALERIHFFIKERTNKVLPFVFMIALFSYPALKAVNSVQELKNFDTNWDTKRVNRFYIMKRIANKELPYQNLKVILWGDKEWDNNYDSFFYFYIMREKGVNLTYRNLISDVQVGDTLLVNEPRTMAIIDSLFAYEVLLSEYDNRIISIQAKK
ncbi:MAG: glycosyltransferase family 39 protein [Bacteroidales bacterium]|jgi:4-amino-4-deoxy-L-arabinose transferase-like glycosyltransferase|nr:glycosyltransferase family 39 protein [Bacteroidales bacterium]